MRTIVLVVGFLLLLPLRCATADDIIPLEKYLPKNTNLRTTQSCQNPEQCNQSHTECLNNCRDRSCGYTCCINFPRLSAISAPRTSAARVQKRRGIAAPILGATLSPFAARQLLSARRFPRSLDFGRPALGARRACSGEPRGDPRAQPSAARSSAASYLHAGLTPARKPEINPPLQFCPSQGAGGLAKSGRRSALSRRKGSNPLPPTITLHPISAPAPRRWV